MATSLTPWRPFGELTELRHRLDRMFEDAFGTEPAAWRPDIDVIAENGELVVRADVPGMKAEDIDIDVQDGILTVSGKHEEKAETEGDGKRFVRRERRFGAFSRSLTLPTGVDPGKIKATCHDGVLEVTIAAPKKREGAVKITPK
jgi:HSP20 family protein